MGLFNIISLSSDLLHQRSRANRGVQGPRQKFPDKKYTEALRILPLWVVSFSLFLISGLTLAINSNASEKNVVVFLSALGLMIRDISIFHAISWNKNIRRPTLGIVIYLVFIYALLPYILKAGDLYKYLFPYVWDKMSGFRPVSSLIHLPTGSC